MKFSTEMVEEIAGYIREGNSHEDAAALAGIDQNTFYVWRRKHSEFAEAMKKAELECKRRNIAVIQAAAAGSKKHKREPIWTAAAWLLERKYHAEYAQRTKGEISGPGGGPIPTVALTVPELRPDLMKRLASMVIPEANGNGGSNGHTVAGAGV